MDASTYFRFTDRIDAAESVEDLALLRDEVRALQAHAMELRALQRRIARRAQAIVVRPMEREVPIAADGAASDRIAPRHRPAIAEHPDGAHAVA
jgi:hypothetical protein